MQNFAFFLFLGTVLVLQSCGLDECGSTKSNFLKKYDAFIAEVEKQDLSFSDKNWETYDAQFESYLENCYERYEEEMTTAENREFWVQSVKYYYKRYGNGFAEELFDEDNELSQTMRRKIRDLERNPEQFLKEVIREIGGEDLEGLFREIGREIEGMGKQLQEWLDQ